MHRSTKQSRQYAEAANQANATLGMIRRTIVTRDKDTILRLYKSLVRPQLEYCIQVWSPHLKQDMEKLEKVQRRVTTTINLQATKLFIVTSTTKGGGGYHPPRFSVRLKLLYCVIQPLIQHCLIREMVYFNIIICYCYLKL